MSNFFKFIKALTPGTILYDRSFNHLFISCGCKPWYHRLVYGLTLRTEIEHTFKRIIPKQQTVKIELKNVKNLRNFDIIGRLK